MSESIGKEITSKVKEVSETIKNRIKSLDFNKLKDFFSRKTYYEITHTIECNVKEINLENAKEFMENLLNDTEQLSNDTINKAKEIISSIDEIKIKEILDSTWIQLKKTPRKAKKEWEEMEKSYKVAVISLMAGGAIVSIAFLIAAGPLSIVGALATIGGGSLASGGFGVAGGIIVTVGGAALSSALAGLVANKLIKDPDVERLIEAYSELEKIIKENYTVIEKNNQKFRKIYKRYGDVANYVAILMKIIEKGGKYSQADIKEYSLIIKVIQEDLNENLSEVTI